MDDHKRDAYNRYGEKGIELDPRANEFHLVLTIMSEYLLWGLIAYVTTIPRSAQGCRTWIGLYYLAMVSADSTFRLLDGEAPKWVAHYTEYDIVMFLHKIFPCVLLLFTALSKFYFVALEEFSVEILENVLSSQRVSCLGTVLLLTFDFCIQEMLGLLHQVQVLTDSTAGASEEQKKEQLRQELTVKLTEFSNTVSRSNSDIGEAVTCFKTSSVNVGESYHWLVFVALYGGTYLLANQ